MRTSNIRSKLRRDARSSNIVIASGGRRTYLVKWFQESMEQMGLGGRIIVTDADPYSAAYAEGDASVQMPAYGHPAYGDAMLSLAQEHRPGILISLNDYEIELLSNGLAAQLRSLGVTVPGLPDQVVQQVTDKYRMYELLTSFGVRTPETVLASDVLGGNRNLPAGSTFVVKHRWGSGSSGLKIANPGTLAHAIKQSIADAPIRSGALPEESVVVQSCVLGQEYGIDLVGTLQGDPGLAGVLARRKIRMRAGETAQAVTVAPALFERLGVELFNALAPSGLVDIDVMIDGAGSQYVIDINPRFGGGYPFSHLAGADVPRYYLSALHGAPEYGDSLGFLEYREGIVSSKFEGVRRVAMADQ